MSFADGSRSLTNGDEIVAGTTKFKLEWAGAPVKPAAPTAASIPELGGTLHIRSVAVKPGKPLTVATFNDNNCLYFGIPGNPVSALVSCWRFVQPALKKLSGIGNYQPQFVNATTRHDLKASGKRETYLWGQLHLVNGKYEFSLAGGSHSSGNLINLAQTNGLAIVPFGQKLITVEEEIRVMLID